MPPKISLSSAVRFLKFEFLPKVTPCDKDAIVPVRGMGIAVRRGIVGEVAALVCEPPKTKSPAAARATALEFVRVRGNVAAMGVIASASVVWRYQLISFGLQQKVLHASII
jgi:hypothetical protein